MQGIRVGVGISRELQPGPRYESRAFQCRRKGGSVDEAAAARVLAVLAALWRNLPAPAADGVTDAATQPQQPLEQQPDQQLTQQVRPYWPRLAVRLPCSEAAIAVLLRLCTRRPARPTSPHCAYFSCSCIADAVEVLYRLRCWVAHSSPCDFIVC
jgi:hypothetical protein